MSFYKWDLQSLFVEVFGSRYRLSLNFDLAGGLLFIWDQWDISFLSLFLLKCLLYVCHY